jgi:hypothetical protein
MIDDRVQNISLSNQIEVWGAHQLKKKVLKKK